MAGRGAATMNSERLRAFAALVGLAVLAAAGLAGLQSLTEERIRANASQRLLDRLQAVLPPPDSYDNAPQLDVLRVRDPALGADGPLPVYRARRDGEPVAAVLTVIAPDGYVDAIRLIVGVDVDGRITGVRALEHNETPGLGDGIETARSDWILQFTGLSLDRRPPGDWALRRDGGGFDVLTGATITSRAVIKAVRRALVYFEDHRQRLLAPDDEPPRRDVVEFPP